mgnify:CR=1 FL=1
MTNYSHLSYEDRKNIEDGLNENKSINQIAKELCRNHSTILREIDRNKKYSEPSAWNNYKINHPDLDLSCERLKHSPVNPKCSEILSCDKCLNSLTKAILDSWDKSFNSGFTYNNRIFLTS